MPTAGLRERGHPSRPGTLPSEGRRKTEGDPGSAGGCARRSTTRVACPPPLRLTSQPRSAPERAVISGLSLSKRALIRVPRGKGGQDRTFRHRSRGTAAGGRCPRRVALRLAAVPSEHSTRYLEAAADLVRTLNGDCIDAIATGLAAVRERDGRLFVMGVGGGAGHASHAVNDFRKLCGIESYAPTDNVSELTARVNDDGWDTVFTEWLSVSRLSHRDAVLAFSVGGGSHQPPVSTNLVNALERAREVGASIYGVAGSPGGALAQLADVAVVVDPPADLRTPLVESLQAVIWHALVSHPELAVRRGHWETLSAEARP